MSRAGRTHLPQQLPTESDLCRSDMVLAPLSSAHLIWLSVTALQIQMNILIAYMIV